jgi:hypothetical protein
VSRSWMELTDKHQGYGEHGHAKAQRRKEERKKKIVSWRHGHAKAQRREEKKVG